MGLDLPPKYQKTKSNPPPYTPGHQDPFDSPVDAIEEDLDPLPWRNGNGASVLGPWNTGRSKQSPDLVRPPSTDSGMLPNMRWSFADSHIRIEVMISSLSRSLAPFCLRVFLSPLRPLPVLPGELPYATRVD